MLKPNQLLQRTPLRVAAEQRVMHHMPSEDDDWRLEGQDHLVGLTLYKKRWTQTRAHWDHDHCEFCNAKFMDDERLDTLREGYTDADEYYWVCSRCFRDFNDRFEWTIVELTEHQPVASPDRDA